MAETKMKALRLHPPGTPQALEYGDAPRPQPRPGEVLIRVVATAITANELIWTETTKRTLPVPGHDVSGVVAAIGGKDNDFKIGELVFALTSFSRDGSAAEYVIALPSELALKPETLTHEQAAAVPLSALTAWQALFMHADLKAGQRVLITGAAGGVGVMALQLAKWVDAYVIGTCSGRNSGFVKGLGADEVIDYTAATFERAVDAVDVLLDCVGSSTLHRSWSLMKEGGVLVSVAEPPRDGESVKHADVKATFFVVEPNGEQLSQIAALIEEGKIKPIVDSVLALSEGVKAFEQLAMGHSRGKVVLRISQ